MSKTDFFIVGAPKCGTSALAVYLNDRSDVFMTDPKEPHFFATDFRKYREVESEDEYGNLYSRASKNQLLGDASVFHLYSKNAVELIRDYNENAKIIVMLRNPVDLVHSFHSQVLFTHDEDVADFSTAWNLCADRRKGNKIPPACRESKLLLYDEIAGYRVQLERLFSAFPRESVCVVLFQNFIVDTSAEFRRISRFLGLPDEHRSDFPRVNPNRRHRSALLSNILYKKVRPLRTPVKYLKSILRIKQFGMLGKLRRMELKYEERRPITDSVRAELVSTYKKDVEYVEQLLDRPLPDWR